MANRRMAASDIAEELLALRRELARNRAIGILAGTLLVAAAALAIAFAARIDAPQTSVPALANVAQCPPANARSNLSLQWLDISCRYRFPPEDGFKGEPTITVLTPGTLVDRYGPQGGRFLSEPGTSYTARALPYDEGKLDYYRYEVVKPLEVRSGNAVPWFDQSGGGIQYKTEKPVRQLLIEGYLKELIRIAP